MKRLFFAFALLASAQSNFVHQQGKQLVDPAGHMFRFELFRELIGPEATDSFWREWRDDIQPNRRAGMNSIRIPLHPALFSEDGPGFPYLHRAIQWCREAGLYAILDLHAATAGQTGTNLDDSWGAASRYRNAPAVLGYDLLNEPIPHFPALQKYDAAPRLSSSASSQPSGPWTPTTS